MITEDYCSFEVAKLLKEKGFDGDGSDYECHMFYSSYSKMIMPIIEIGLVSDFDEVYYAPTHQMAMKWLREKYNILICIIPQEIVVGYDKLCYAIYRITEDLYQPLYNGKIDNLVDSYEETVEAALKYTLEKIL